MDAPTLPGLEVETSDADASEVVKAAQVTIDALRSQNTIQAWHELDCAIVIEAARGVTSTRGVAKAHMFNALLQARAKLPEPVIAETDDVVQMEADRIDEWFAAHAADPADVPNEADAAPVL